MAERDGDNVLRDSTGGYNGRWDGERWCVLPTAMARIRMRHTAPVPLCCGFVLTVVQDTGTMHAQVPGGEKRENDKEGCEEQAVAQTHTPCRRVGSTMLTTPPPVRLSNLVTHFRTTPTEPWGRVENSCSTGEKGNDTSKANEAIRTPFTTHTRNRGTTRRGHTRTNRPP